MVSLRPALFLDMDGTVVEPEEGDFINDPSEVTVIEGRRERIREYVSTPGETNPLVLGVTNQAGVAFGHMSLTDYRRIRAKIRSEVPELHAIEFSPCHPDGDDPAFGTKTLLRKPQVGMLAALERRCLRKWHAQIHFERSLFVGDRDEDQECAERAGIDFQWASDFF